MPDQNREEQQTGSVPAQQNEGSSYDEAVHEGEPYTEDAYLGDADDPGDSIAADRALQEETGQALSALPEDQAYVAPDEYPASSGARAGGYDTDKDPVATYAAMGDPVPGGGDPAPVDPGSAPQVLYSTRTGAPYPIGTPEYQAGIGPEGEPLVAEVPAVAEASGAPEFAPSVADPLDPGEEAIVLGGDHPEHGGPGIVDPLEVAETAARGQGREHRNETSVGPEFDQPGGPSMDPSAQEPPSLPEPGPFSEPATLTLFQDQRPVQTIEVDVDEIVIGRGGEGDKTRVDLSEFDEERKVAERHASIHRVNKKYALYANSDDGVQLNNFMLRHGDRRPLKDGDVIVIAEAHALKFELPALHDEEPEGRRDAAEAE